MSKSLYERLKENYNTDNYPMHMPGHKRNTKLLGDELPIDIDITEIEGFDNLHEPQGILKESMDRVRDYFGVRDSIYMVNGSTGGILSCIRAAVKNRGRILVARNSHKSVYHAIELLELRPVYLTPLSDESTAVLGSISVDQVREKLEAYPDIELVMITSPTFDGVVSDVKAIADLCHERNIPLLVDEAHGAHFAFDSRFPTSATALGADMVVQSLHKTLPAMTSTSIVHVQGDLITTENLMHQLAIFETTSPSYVLMASIDFCYRFLMEKGPALWDLYFQRLDAFSEKMKGLKHLKVLRHGNDRLEDHPSLFDHDKGRIVISTRYTNLTGQELFDLLAEDYDLILEMAYGSYCLAITTIADTEEGFDRLADALLEIDATLKPQEEVNPMTFSLPQAKCTIAEAMARESEFVPFEQSAGRISAEYTWAYPPGIPLLTPGEQLNETFIREILDLSSLHTRIRSDGKRMPKDIQVLKED